MEFRQLRYFVRVVELGSMGRAAADLGLGTSALSQQITRLENELSTRLLQRTTSGVKPTDAGLAFMQQAQLALRHADDAVRAAQQARLSGHVSVGFAPSTAAVLGVPFIQAMRERYPDVRLHLVESLSGHLGSMLDSRQLDIAVLFETDASNRWSAMPLLDERLFLVGARTTPGMPVTEKIKLDQLLSLPLILPSAAHGLRAIVNAAFSRAHCEPDIVLEVDGLALLMDAVRSGLGVTIQPGAATVRFPPEIVGMVEIADPGMYRRNLLASLPGGELSPAALVAKVVLLEVARALVDEKRWPGASLHKA